MVEKLYMCCNDEACPTRQRALQVSGKAGLETHSPSHDGFGEFISLKPLSSEGRNQFNSEINKFSVSKFGARKIVHPKTNTRS